MTDSIVITGAGIVSALGVGKDATLQALIDGRSGIDLVKYLTTIHTEFPVGEVALTDADMAQSLGVGYPISELRTALLGLTAAREAVASACLTADDLRRAAFISGTTVGGMDKTEKHFATVLEANADTPESCMLKYNDCGYSTELIAEELGPFRMLTTTSTACSSAANAILMGANLIRFGLVDIAVVGGAEGLTRFHLNGFNTLMILDRKHCRPFDKSRAGINLGEGAAYLVLERAHDAKARGADILGVLSGWANTCDAFHQTATSNDGEGAFQSMTKAMQMAGLNPDDIDYVNAHGTGTSNNDSSELAAMKRIWGDKLPPVSSTKAFTGHTTSASGSIESVICLLALNHSFLPQSLGCDDPIDDCKALLLNTKLGVDAQHIINNSFGFGGNDTTLILSKYIGK
jgi:3-oxoacyl-[acyl-carrier-protein] synthase-1